jgi:hypothetical protein
MVLGDCKMSNYLVPHGVKLFLDRSEQASKCTVTRIGNGGVVTARTLL